MLSHTLLLNLLDMQTTACRTYACICKGAGVYSTTIYYSKGTDEVVGEDWVFAKDTCLASLSIG